MERAPHPHHITRHRDGFPFGTTVVTREEEGDVGVDFEILRMKAGERQELAFDDKELALVLLEGACNTEVDGIEHPVSRTSVFDERPSVVSLPAQERIKLTAESEVEWAVVKTTNHKQFMPGLFVPESTASEARGKGLAQDASLRIVRTVFDHNNKPESNLVIGEVVHLAGRWSSYPPHHHDQPELYHYRFTEPQGYGHAELGDDVVKVKQYDTVKILGGVDHPQVAAPGYGMYYLWIVRHQPGNPYTGFTYTRDHKWLLDEKQQGWLPKEML